MMLSGRAKKPPRSTRSVRLAPGTGSAPAAALGAFALYFVAFVALTFPAILYFSSHFFCDLGDGLQNVWNIWWVNKALTEEGTSPWHTTVLYYPSGFSLHGTTLNPFNGFLGIPLLRVFSLRETHNLIVIFSFVVSGVTAFLLAYHVTGSYRGSLVAGYLFTFSEFHFAHAEGHLQLVSTEWLPLFVLLWWKLVTEPRIRLGLGAATVLFLVYLCDYYYFAYSCAIASAIVVWRAWMTGDVLFLVRGPHRRALVAFSLMAVATIGPLVYGFLRAHLADPFIGGHSSLEGSMDLLAPLIPGAHSRFATMTERWWSRFAGDVHDNSAYLGLSVIGLLCFTWFRRREVAVPSLGFWYTMLLGFSLLALGPRPQVGGHTVPWVVLPYAVLEKLPLVSLSGMPGRMVVMITLSAAVLCAAGFPVLERITARRPWVLAAFLFVVFVEYLPRLIPLTDPPVVPYVTLLREKTGVGSVLEVADPPTPPALALYYQTIHGKPLTFGYTARTTRRIRRRNAAVRELVAEGRYDALRQDYAVAYIVADHRTIIDARFDWTPLPNHFRLGRLYDLTTFAAADTRAATSAIGKPPRASHQRAGDG